MSFGCMPAAPEHFAQLEAIAAAVRIGPDSVAVGDRVLAAPPEARAQVLARLLYEECFVKDVGEREPTRDPRADTDGFVAALSAANAGVGRVDAGWRPIDHDGDRVVVEKDDRRFSVREEHVVLDGERAELRLPNEDQSTSADYYYVYGDALPVAEPLRPRTRFYVNLEAAGAPHLLGALTQQLNAERIAFSLKCFRDPHDYYRRDGMVIYADANASARVAAILTACGREPQSRVRDATPPFTERIAPGIASAPEPEAESYGERCCRLLAQTLIEREIQTAGPPAELHSDGS
jgi:HopA1 effector protein family